LKERTDKISLYYSIADTLTESRKNDERIDFDKKDSKKVKNIVGNVLKSKTKVSKNALTNKLKSIKPKKEIDELVDSDGSMLSSKIPFLNQTLTPHKTTDQTVAMARITNDPLTRGYRVYYGEGKEETDEVINEVDYSEAFGYAETKDMDYNDTINTLVKMGIEDKIEADKRARQFGKIPKQKREDGELKQRLSEKDSIEEQQKQKMIKMVEDMLTKKSSNNSDVVKDKGISKILLKNIQSIKKIADKEGISINMLIKALKSNE
jgi:hypothetical protein